MKKIYWCLSCVVIVFAGCSDRIETSLPTGYFVDTMGCDDQGSLDVIRIAKEIDVYKARLQRFTCNDNGSFTLDYGEFKGAAPVDFTPQPVPKEGIHMSGFIPPKSHGGRFSIYLGGELDFAFEKDGKNIRKFPNDEDRQELAYLNTNDGKNLPQEIQRAVRLQNLNEGFVKFTKFAEEGDSIQVERHDLHQWFSKKSAGQ